MATIFLNLQDNASDALRDFSDELEGFGERSRAVTAEGERFNAVHNEITQTIAAERKTVVAAAADTTKMTAETAKAVAEAGAAYQIYRIKAVAASVAVGTFNAAQLAIRNAVPIATEVIASQGTAMNGLRNAAVPVLKLVTGLGIEIAALTVATKAYLAVLDATGKRVNEFGETSTNLDRLWGAVAGLTSEVTTNLKTGLGLLGEQVVETTGIRDLWEAIDFRVTRASDQFVENVGHVDSLVEYLGLASAATTKFDDYVRRTADDFSRLAEISKKFGDRDEAVFNSKSAEKYARRFSELGERIAANGQLEQNITSENLTKTIERIDEEIRRRTAAAAEQSRLNKFTAEEAATFEREVSALREARTERQKQLDQLEKGLHKSAVESYVAQQKEAERNVASAQYERLAESEREYREHTKRLEREARLAVEIERDANHQILENVIARIERENGSRETLHRAKQRQLELETRYKLEDAKSDEARFEILKDFRLRSMRAESQFQREESRRKLEEHRAAAAEQIRIEQEKQQRLKALADQITSVTGVTGQQLLAGVSPQATLRALQQSRRAEAEAAQRRAFESQPGFQDASQAERRRMENRIRSAGTKAAAGAFADFRSGQVDPTELAQAQTKAGQEQIQALQKQGRLSVTTSQAVGEMLRAAAETQATTQILQQQMQALLNQSRQVSSQAAATRMRAQRNSL